MPRTPVEAACASSLETILTGFVGALKARAERKPLAASDLDRVLEAFLKGDSLDAAARLCAHAVDRNQAEHMKENAFGRIVVRPISGLLDTVLPRARLRSLFEAMRTIVGSDAIDAAEAACSEAVERLLAEKGAKFSWDDLYGDREARIAADDVLALVGMAFIPNFAKRIDWFSTLLNHDIHSVSMGSHAFVQIQSDEPPKPVAPAVAEEILRLVLSEMNPTGMEAWRFEALQSRHPGAAAALATLCALLSSRADGRR